MNNQLLQHLDSLQIAPGVVDSTPEADTADLVAAITFAFRRAVAAEVSCRTPAGSREAGDARLAA